MEDTWLQLSDEEQDLLRREPPSCSRDVSPAYPRTGRSPGRIRSAPPTGPLTESSWCAGAPTARQHKVILRASCRMRNPHVRAGDPPACAVPRMEYLDYGGRMRWRPFLIAWTVTSPSLNAELLPIRSYTTADGWHRIAFTVSLPIPAAFCGSTPPPSYNRGHRLEGGTLRVSSCGTFGPLGGHRTPELTWTSISNLPSPMSC